MRILVTGATGFIGRHLVARVLHEVPQAEVICLVKPPANDSELAALAAIRHAGLRVIEGDLNEPGVSPELSPDFDVVFHLAANIDTAASEAELKVNDVGTQHLLSWLGRAIRDGRVVYSSSIAVLDRDGPADGPLNESSPCVPRTEYGCTKHRGEQILQGLAGPQRFTYTILRLATVYGPGLKTGGLFDQLVRLNAEQKILGRLDWPGRTSIIHVDDVTAIMLGLARNPKAANEIYCVANSDAPTVGTLSEHIGRLVPAPASRVHLPRWVWRFGRTVAWNRAAQLFIAPLAQTIFWRFSLLVDDGFWFDTAKLQAIWLEPLVGLDEGLIRLLATLIEQSNRLG